MAALLGFWLSLGLLLAAIAAALTAAALPLVGRGQVKKSLRGLSQYDTTVISQKDMAEIAFTQRSLVAFRKLARLGRRLSPAKLATNLNQQLTYAGMPENLDKILAAKSVGLIVGVVVAIVVSLFLTSGLLRIVVIILLPVAGLFSPDLWLAAQVNARQKEIRLSLPGLLDLLAVSVEAGLGFDSALARVIKNMSGPLPEEFARMLKEVQMGASRQDAFKSLSGRTNVTELRSFLSAMIQADIFGISIAETLRVQAHEMRIKRRQKAEMIAQKAPVKLVFPMILCIFPALFVVLLGPAAIRIYGAVIGSMR